MTMSVGQGWRSGSSPVEPQWRFPKRKAIEVARHHAFHRLDMFVAAGVDADGQGVGARIEGDERVARPVGAACVLGKGHGAGEAGD